MNQLTLFWLLVVSLSLITMIVILIPLWRKKTRLALILTALVVIIVPIVATLLYMHWGGADALKKYYEFRTSQHKEQLLAALHHNPSLLIERMKAVVEKNPRNDEGWYLLGSLYFKQTKYQDAYNSFIKAYQLNPKKLTIQLAVAESSFLVNQQQLTPQTKQLLYGVLQNAPDQPDALNLLAMDAFHHNEFDKAITYWQKMLVILPADSNSAVIVKRAIAMAQKQLNDRKVK